MQAKKPVRVCATPGCGFKLPNGGKAQYCPTCICNRATIRQRNATIKRRLGAVPQGVTDGAEIPPNPPV